jgi:hypothetical protein
MSKNFKGSSTREGQIIAQNQYNDPFEVVGSDSLAWNDFVSGLGMKMAHWVFVPYVIGASDTGAIRNYDEQTVKKTNDADIYVNTFIKVTYMLFGRVTPNAKYSYLQGTTRTHPLQSQSTDIT